MKGIDSSNKKDFGKVSKGTFFSCTVCGARKRSFYHLWLCKERHKRDILLAERVGVEE